jgi:hypothetical protein
MALLAGCATPYAKVKTAKTIDEARSYLGDYQPEVLPYPPNAEAWYFGRNECVLFIDGKLRMSKDTYSQRVSSTGRESHLQPGQVLCSPSAMDVR